MKEARDQNVGPLLLLAPHQSVRTKGWIALIANGASDSGFQFCQNSDLPWSASTSGFKRASGDANISTFMQL